ncbi:MAG: hypothetical protein ABIZ05_03085 [Pseudonocardiaceae bacterium]
MSTRRSGSESRFPRNHSAARPRMVPPQNSHDPVCQVLGEVLVDGVRSGRGAEGGVGSVAFRACVTLYSLLVEHPVDQWGRCRSCRRSGAVFGARWRQCRVHGKATLCLRQLDEVLLLGLLAEALPAAASGAARAGDP